MSPSDQVFRPPSAPTVGARPSTGPGSDNGAPATRPVSTTAGASTVAPPAPSTAPMAAAPAMPSVAPPGTSPAGAPGSNGAPAFGQAPRPSAPPKVNGTAAGQPAAAAGPRRVRLTIARVDPWSVLKLSFLLSVALGIGLVTASLILWEVLNGMGVFSKINEMVADVTISSKVDIYDYVGLSRVVSLSTFVAVINVVIIMALSTLGAVLYNLAGSLVGGLQVTLSDD